MRTENVTGLFEELASYGSRSTFGIRPQLLREGGVSEFFKEITEAVDLIEGNALALHRPFGEPNFGDAVDFDAMTQASNNPVLKEYATEVVENIQEFVESRPDITLFVYIGSLRCLTMQRHKLQGFTAWSEAIDSELTWLYRLIEQGRNLQLVWDHSSSYDVGSLEWIEYVRSSVAYPGKVWLEACPNPENPHTLGHQSFCSYDRIMYMLRRFGYELRDSGSLDELVVFPQGVTTRLNYQRCIELCANQGFGMLMSMSTLNKCEVTPEHFKINRAESIARSEVV